MTKKTIGQVAENILTTNKIWLKKIDFVSELMKNWLREDCREHFKYYITTYCGDVTCGFIDIVDLGEFLEQQEFEAELLIRELRKIYDFATANQIQEILFD